MVCTANDLQRWKDFPKGLRILLLDEDNNSAAEIRSKLEGMDYFVSTFCNEDKALSAISDKSESFHVAIVGVSTNNSNGSFKFLENAKDLPTIMTSNIYCLTTMMKCIALGAVEFLQKPLSEDKLRNIWQHVVHKAFNAEGSILSESLKPVKESVVSMLQLQLDNRECENKIFIEIENVCQVCENEHEQLGGSEAPSTPQLKQGGRLLDDGDCQDQTNCSTEKESGEQDGESKSVETICGNSIAEVKEDHPLRQGETVIKEEDDLAVNYKRANNISPQPCNKEGQTYLGGGGSAENPKKAFSFNNSRGNKSNRKNMKVDWTSELHKKFVQAVEQLGVGQAIPSRILEMMKVEGLTRHNIASHLQKYRIQQRHILPKEDDLRWPQSRHPMQRIYYPHKPVMGFPPYHSNHAFPNSPDYPVWGAPSSHPAGVHMWAPPGYPPWQLTESWHWKPYLGLHANTWSCHVIRPPHGPCSSFPQIAPGFHNTGIVDNSCSMPGNTFDFHPEEEVIDKVVKEAINKPWLPLPLGLKPPSTDMVIAELSSQGICSIPSHIP